MPEQLVIMVISVNFLISLALLATIIVIVVQGDELINCSGVFLCMNTYMYFCLDTFSYNLRHNLL